MFPEASAICHITNEVPGMPRKPTQLVLISLRIQERLRAQLEKAAKKNGRSLNAQMATMLEDALRWGPIEERMAVWDASTATAQRLTAAMEKMFMSPTPEQKAVINQLREEWLKEYPEPPPKILTVSDEIARDLAKTYTPEQQALIDRLKQALSKEHQAEKK
jgi:hypothetical protein